MDWQLHYRERQPDYKNVAVIAAGTDPDSPVNKLCLVHAMSIVP